MLLLAGLSFMSWYYIFRKSLTVPRKHVRKPSQFNVTSGAAAA